MPCHTQNSLHGQTGSNLMSLKRSVTLPKNQLLYLRHLPRPGTQTKSIPSSSLIIVCWDSIQEKTAWNCCESFRRTNPYKTIGAHWGLSCNTPQRFTGGLPAPCTSCHIPSLVHRQNPSTRWVVKLFFFVSIIQILRVQLLLIQNCYWKIIILLEYFHTEKGSIMVIKQFELLITHWVSIPFPDAHSCIALLHLKACSFILVVLGC